MPGMSVHSEHVFTTAGNTVNKKRAALDPDQVDRLVFLASNIKKYIFLADFLLLSLLGCH